MPLPGLGAEPQLFISPSLHLPGPYYPQKKEGHTLLFTHGNIISIALCPNNDS